MQIVNSNELPGRTFEGYHYGDVNVSFFLSETRPGKGPALHSHPYTEVFVIETGKLEFVVGDTTIEATAGQIVIVPPGVLHKFTNTTDQVVRHIDIHTSSRMETTFVEK